MCKSSKLNSGKQVVDQSSSGFHVVEFHGASLGMGFGTVISLLIGAVLIWLFWKKCCRRSSRTNVMNLPTATFTPGPQPMVHFAPPIWEGPQPMRMPMGSSHATELFHSQLRRMMSQIPTQRLPALQSTPELTRRFFQSLSHFVPNNDQNQDAAVDQQSASSEHNTQEMS